MSIPPERIPVGQCYLPRGDKRRGEEALGLGRVLQILSNGRVQYELRRGPVEPGHPWPRQRITSIMSFARQAKHEVPCNGTPER